MAVHIESPNGRTFEDVRDELANEQRLTTDIILFYCSLYANIEELGRQKNELSDLVKDALLKDQKLHRGETLTVGPKDSPYQLSVLRTNPSAVDITDWEAVSQDLKKMVSVPLWKKIIAKHTRTSTAEPQMRLNPPGLNPDYKKL